MRTWMRGARTLTATLALTAAFTSCSVLESGDDEIMLVNSADEPWIAFVVELETSHLLDPNPGFAVPPGDPRIIGPGASRTLGTDDVQGGYARGDDVRVFLYAVSSGQATLEDMLTIRHTELAVRRFRIEIP